MIQQGILFIVFSLLVTTAQAADQPAPTRSTNAFNNPIPNIPGKSLLGVIVEYPPGGHNPPHRHASSAFITAYVLDGAIRSQIDEAPPKIYHAGEYFTEKPGAHHMISENASQTQPARMLAIFVLDTGQTPLTIPDQ